MKTQFRIIESDKFYVQDKKNLRWKYIYDDDFLEGWQAFFGIVGLVGILVTTALAIVLAIRWFCEMTIPNPLIIIFASICAATPLMFIILQILRNSRKMSFNSFEYAKEFVDRRIQYEETEENKILKKKEDREKRKHKKIHYLDIKTERKEKLNKIESV